jgi:diguanylate cyclase (GGDEF)-like protein
VEAIIYPNYSENGTKTGYTAIRFDITAKKQVEDLLKLSKLNEEKIKQYVDLVDKNIITSSTDISGKITYISEAFAQISGYTKDELMGKSHRVVKHEDNEPAIYDNMWETISNNRVWHGEIKNKKKDGGFYWVDATIYPTFNQYGEKTGYTAIRIDITNKKRVEDLLITDALTNIYNRRYFNEMMPKAINLAKRDRKYFSFIIMDIDHFKQYNDTYGHQEGDEVLIQVASAIYNSLNRASDMCFRLGGEEFGVIFESLDPQEAYLFANNIRQNIENLQIEHSGNSASAYVTVSMGLIAKKTLEELDQDQLYKETDDLLYKAKESGRNRVEAN